MAGGEKMSKSLGNVVTVGELLAQGHKGEVLRFALLSAHYRQPLEWSRQLVAQSKATLDRLYRAAGDAEAGDGRCRRCSRRWPTISTRRWRSSRLSAIEDGGDACAASAAPARPARSESAAAWFQGEGDARIDALIAARAEAEAAPRLRRGRPDPRRAGGGGDAARGRPATARFGVAA